MKTTEKLCCCVCVRYGWGGGRGWGLHAPSARVSVIHFEISNRMTDQPRRTRDIVPAEGDLGGTGVLTTTGAALWYERGEQSSLVICIDGLAANAKASRDTGNHTQFSKARDRVQRSTAHGQAVWVLCEVNVHIHIMYRHHEHLHSWVSGCFFFKKSVMAKMFWAPPLSRSESRRVRALGGSCGRGGGSDPPGCGSAVLCSSTVCVLWNAKNRPVRLFTWERETRECWRAGVGRGGGQSRPQWEWSDGRGSHRISWRCRSGRCQEDREGRWPREGWWCPASC